MPENQSEDYHALLRQRFEAEIKDRWLEKLSVHDHGRGDTLELLLGKKRDNLAVPDFGDIELKASKGTAPVTLFTKAPKQASVLSQQYGAGGRGLHATLSSKKFTASAKNSYDFKLIVDRAKRRLNIAVQEKSGRRVPHGDVYWSFDDLESTVHKKLARIALVSYLEDPLDKTKIRYTDFTLLEGLTFERFLHAVEAGDLSVDIRLSSSGHDHGTAFRMSPAKLRKYGEGTEALAAVPKQTVARKIFDAVEKTLSARAKQPRVRKVRLRYNAAGQPICWKCKRPLTDPKSIARGYGPSCAPPPNRWRLF